jgi:hypothetical protein
MKHKVNVRTLETSTTRDDFTKHGLHLNAAGKNKIAKQMSQNILPHSTNKKTHHIILGWTTSLLDRSTRNDTTSVRYKEHMGDSKEVSSNNQIASIIQDMDTSNLKKDHPQEAVEQQMIITSINVKRNDLKDPNAQEIAGEKQMNISSYKDRSEDLIDLNTHDIAQDEQMTTNRNKVGNYDQIDPKTQEIAEKKQSIIINKEMRSDDQKDLNTKDIRMSTRTKRLPNTRSNEFL